MPGTYRHEAGIFEVKFDHTKNDKQAFSNASFMRGKFIFPKIKTTSVTIFMKFSILILVLKIIQQNHQEIQAHLKNLSKMKKLKYLSAISSLFILFHSNAQSNDEWIHAGKNDSRQWDIAKNSADNTFFGKDKDKAISVVIQSKSLKNSDVNIYRVYIKHSDCIQGYGNVHFNTLDYKYVDTTSFAMGGPSIADSVAKISCDGLRNIYKVNTKTNDFEWVLAAENSKETIQWFLATNSIRKSKSKNNSIIKAIVREHSKPEQSNEYLEINIPSNLCKSGYGNFFWLRISDDKKINADYAKSGASVNSSIADQICSQAI